MPRRTHNAMYFADDKDIQDLLMSSKRNLATERLLELARKRGIYLSRDLPREQVVEYLKGLAYNWPQLRSLVEATETPDRPERSTYTDVKGGIDSVKLESSLQRLQTARSGSHGEVIQITSSKDGTHTISVEYSELDQSKARLFQRKGKSLHIQIEQQAGGVRVRHEDNARAHEIVDTLLGTVVESSSITPVDRIDLSGIKDPSLRTKFFVDLMRQMRDFRLEDVCYMGVATLQPSEEDTVGDEQMLADESEDVDGEDDDGDGEEAEKTLTEGEIALVGVVKKAALEGENLLVSNEYQRFEKAGFFISRSSWLAVEKSGQRRRVEFDARFSDASAAKGFSYRVVATYEASRGGRYRKLPQSPCGDRDLCRAVEDAARDAAEQARKAAAEQASPSAEGEQSHDD